MLFTDKTPYLGGTKMSSAYIGGQKVWPGRDPAFAGWEAVFDQYQPHNEGADIGVNRDGGIVSIDVTKKRSYLGQISAVCKNASGTIKLVQEGREAISVAISGSSIRVASTGDRGKYPIDFTVPYPTSGSYHLVQVTTNSHWYGYSVDLLIDGNGVASHTNGGGFNLSEHLLLTTKPATLTISGGITVVGWNGEALVGRGSSSSPETKRRMQQGVVCWATYQSSGPVNSFIPAADTQAWLVSGGQGGQGGGGYTDGNSGAGGVSIKLPWFVEGHSLAPGPGGAGGASGIYSRGGQYGASGSASTYGEYSTAGAETRESTLSAWGSTATNNVGLGGEGGDRESSSTDSDGNTTYYPASNGFTGGSGGLVVARRWTSKGMVAAIVNDLAKWDERTVEGDKSLFVVQPNAAYLEVMADVTCDRDVRSREGTIISKGTVLSRGMIIAAAESAMGTQQFVFTGV